MIAHPVPSIVSHHPSQSFSVDDGQANSLDVTVVLPCYNEQNHVRDELERIAKALDASDFSYELLIIDDKSTDNTLAVLREELPRYPHMRLMPFRRNGGSGTARRTWSAPIPSCPTRRSSTPLSPSTPTAKCPSRTSSRC